jgi:hypothetical protein
VATNGYFGLNYHWLLTATNGIILLMALNNYFIGGYWWIFWAKLP